jgi:hypothetical protein
MAHFGVTHSTHEWPNHSSQTARVAVLVVALAIGAFDIGSFAYLKAQSVDFVAARRLRDAPPYKPGTTTSWQGQAPGALFGWYQPNATGTWSAGTASALAVKLPYKPAGDMLLTIKAGASVEYLKLPARPVDVLVNGTLVAKWQLDSAHVLEYIALVPSSLLTDDRVLRIDFRFQPVQRPRDFGVSADSRRLAMRLVEWRLEPVSP